MVLSMACVWLANGEKKENTQNLDERKGVGNLPARSIKGEEEEGKGNLFRHTKKKKKANMTTTSPIILDEQFTVKEVNPNGQKYQRVSRVVFQCTKSDITVTADVNTSVYPIELEQHVTIAIASTLDLNGQPESDTYDHSVYPQSHGDDPLRVRHVRESVRLLHRRHAE